MYILYSIYRERVTIKFDLLNQGIDQKKEKGDIGYWGDCCLINIRTKNFFFFFSKSLKNDYWENH